MSRPDPLTDPELVATAVVLPARACALLVHLVGDHLAQHAQRCSGEAHQEIMGILDKLRVAATLRHHRVSGWRNGETVEGDGPPQWDPDLIDTTEAAAMLGVSPRRVQQLARELGGVKAADGRWSVSRLAVEDYKRGSP